MNSSQQINVRHLAEGGVSAIDCLELLRSELRSAQGKDKNDNKKASGLVWEQSCKKMKEMEGVNSKIIQGYSTPVLTTQRHLQALICRTRISRQRQKCWRQERSDARAAAINDKERFKHRIVYNLPDARAAAINDKERFKHRMGNMIS